MDLGVMGVLGSVVRGSLALRVNGRLNPVGSLVLHHVGRAPAKRSSIKTSIVKSR